MAKTWWQITLPAETVVGTLISASLGILLTSASLLQSQDFDSAISTVVAFVLILAFGVSGHLMAAAILARDTSLTRLMLWSQVFAAVCLLVWKAERMDLVNDGTIVFRPSVEILGVLALLTIWSIYFLASSYWVRRATQFECGESE